ncbi:MAG: hypothetical protein KatS3mg058_2284 [Roseiflexus sp.]|nr:MAG: hypothetical protein KatS3mg058_2284 [Roseiflexus sp.]
MQARGERYAAPPGYRAAPGRTRPVAGEASDGAHGSAQRLPCAFASLHLQCGQNGKGAGQGRVARYCTFLRKTPPLSAYRYSGNQSPWAAIKSSTNAQI